MQPIGAAQCNDGNVIVVEERCQEIVGGVKRIDMRSN
jgi:hypothetical protein